MNINKIKIYFFLRFNLFIELKRTKIRNTKSYPSIDNFIKENFISLISTELYKFVECQN
jgi:hypothetical protein